MAPIVIAGGGLAGLIAAIECEKRGEKPLLIEAGKRLGGRVATQSYQGFLLDKGFQVLLSSYPEIQPFKKDLCLRAFYSGAKVHQGMGFSLYHPLKHPLAFFTSLPFVPTSYYLDFIKLGLSLLKNEVGEGSTQEYLSKKKISHSCLEHFIKPFFGGVFLEDSLNTHSQLFLDYLRGFFKGRACLPKKGMKALPELLEKQLKTSDIIKETEVLSFDEKAVYLQKEAIEYKSLILALDNPSLTKLYPGLSYRSQAVRVFYYACPKGVLTQLPLLHLLHSGPLSNVCMPNMIQPSYAPLGYDLISATVFKGKYLKKNDLEKQVSLQLQKLFNIPSHSLSFLKDFYLSHALPSQLVLEKNPLILPPKVYLAGEAVSQASINGALYAGKQAARQALASI